jgi:hypothetical protein
MQTHPKVELHTPAPNPRRGRLGRRALLAEALVVAALRPAAAGDLVVDGSFVSTVPTGTPPLSVASTTPVENLNADLLDGLDASAFARTPAQVLWVSPSGGHFTSVQDALDAITDASQLKPYLIRVGPGIYTGEVTMKPYVDIEGSGEGLTILRAFGGVTVTGASNAVLRDLTVQNLDDGVSGGKGIYNFGAAPNIVRVTVRAQATAGSPVGIFNDAAAIAPAPVLRHVTVFSIGPGAVGIRNDGVAVQIYDSEVYASGNEARGIINENEAGGTLMRVRASATSAETDVSLIVGVVNAGSLVRMVDVEASAVGGQANYGVSNGGASERVKMTRVRATASANGGSSTYAVRNWEGDTDMVDCELRAFGGSTFNYALWNNRSSTRIYRSVLDAAGGGQSYALFNNDTSGGSGGGAWAVEVHASQLWAQTAMVRNVAGFDTRIGGSSLAGGGLMVNTGTLVCAGVYDDAFTFYFDSCP